LNFQRLPVFYLYSVVKLIETNQAIYSRQFGFPLSF